MSETPLLPPAAHTPPFTADILETVTQSIGAGLAVISRDFTTLWTNQVMDEIYGDTVGRLCYHTFQQQKSVCPGCGVREVFEQGIMADGLFREPQGVADNQPVLVVAHQHQGGEVKAQQFTGKAGDLSVQTVQVNGADQALREGEKLIQRLFLLFALGNR